MFAYLILRYFRDFRPESWCTVSQYVNLTRNTRYSFSAHMKSVNTLDGFLYHPAQLNIEIEYTGTQTYHFTIIKCTCMDNAVFRPLPRAPARRGVDLFYCGGGGLIDFKLYNNCISQLFDVK